MAHERNSAKFHITVGLAELSFFVFNNDSLVNYKSLFTTKGI